MELEDHQVMTGGAESNMGIGEPFNTIHAHTTRADGLLP